MKDLQICYPEGKKQAVTFSYDDGQEADRHLVEIFNQYGMKATFHLNSGTLGTDGFIKREEISRLYAGHEISCHGVEHAYFTHLSSEGLIREVWEDRRELEKLAGYPVCGISYPFGVYSDSVADTLEKLGIIYARTTKATNRFGLPENLLRWNPTCHHNDDIMKLADSFLNQPDYARLPLFYIWGHSFEFERQGNWNRIEEFCKKISGQSSVWYASNLEIARYIKAIRALVSDVESNFMYNSSAVTIWFYLRNQLYSIKPNELLNLTEL